MADLSKNSILYMPDSEDEALAIVQVIHGMAEHQGRYRDLAHYLAGNGFAVITSDMRGHGNNIARNSELGFFGDNSVARIIGDIHDNTLYIKEHFPDIPYIIIGYGIGSFAASIYFKKFDNFPDGLFLCSLPSERSSLQIAEFLLKILITFRGEYHRSKLINSLFLSLYSKQYYKDGSDYSWLSVDEDNVFKFDADPKCGFIYTLNGFKTILDLMIRTYKKGSWIRKHLHCPIRLFYGGDDPSILNSPSMMKSVHMFSDQGYSDVAYITYPGIRHDIFHDIKKDKVFSDILTELKHITDISAAPEPVKASAGKPVHIVLDDFVDPEVDKPLEKDEKINLEEFIDSHKEETGEDNHSVEMIDFSEINIEDFINQTPDSKSKLE